MTASEALQPLAIESRLRCFTIEEAFSWDNWTFFGPDGIAVPDCGYHARETVDDDIGEQSENPPRGGLLSAVEKLVSERRRRSIFINALGLTALFHRRWQLFKLFRLFIYRRDEWLGGR